MKIIVLGAGAWGTALSIHLSKYYPGKTILWMRSKKMYQNLSIYRENRKYLPDISFPVSLELIYDFHMVKFASEDMLIFAMPFAGLKDTIQNVLTENIVAKNWVYACKGIDQFLRLPHQLLSDLYEIDKSKYVHGLLSGPSFAKEIAQGRACALSFASFSKCLIKKVKYCFQYNNFQIYETHDMIGVALGGAIKNVLSIAIGIADGIGLGLNERAILLTKSLSEMCRLIVSCGGLLETAIGLSGFGDLILTATGNLSRNRYVGLELSNGKSLKKILKELGHVAEGVDCASSIKQLAKEKNIDIPVTSAVYEVLFHGMDPKIAIQSLVNFNKNNDFY